MYRARLVTRHFTFEAYSETKSGASGAMRAGLIRHAKQYEKHPGKLIADHWEDVEVVWIEMGSCYRDNEKLTNL
jgi:hypothetical protein